MIGVLLIVLLAGAAGGLVSTLLANELYLPRVDTDGRIFRPGVIGNVVVGAVAATVMWGLYGPLAGQTLVDAAGVAKGVASLKVSELAGALLTGIGGSRILGAEVDKRALQLEKDSLNQAKLELAGAVKAMSQGNQ